MTPIKTPLFPEICPIPMRTETRPKPSPGLIPMRTKIENFTERPIPFPLLPYLGLMDALRSLTYYYSQERLDFLSIYSFFLLILCPTDFMHKLRLEASKTI